MPENRKNMVMIMMKYGVALAIIAGLLVGISSGGFVTEPMEINNPNWSGFTKGYINPFSYVPEKTYYAIGPLDPITLKPITKLIEPVENVTNISDTIELVMPLPLPITKAELFSSLATTTPQKQSLLASTTYSTQKQSLLASFMS